MLRHALVLIPLAACAAEAPTQHASARLLGSAPAWSYESNIESATLSESLAGIGDLDGDGYGDIAVGAPGISALDTRDGQVLVFKGGPTGTALAPTWTLSGGEFNLQMGRSVAAAGDTNGDGFPDLAVGTYGGSAGIVGKGRAFVFAGGAGGLPDSPLWETAGDQVAGFLGEAVAGAGDVNGDGFDDLLVGEQLYDGAFDDEGRVHLFLGSPTGPADVAAWTVSGGSTGALFGDTLGPAGDINADGYDDVVVGATQWSGRQPREGQVRLFLGSAGGLPDTPDWTFSIGVADAYLGESASGLGDIDADGYDDVVVTAPGAGMVYVFHGSLGGLPASPDEALTYASRVHAAGAGDINRDGFADLVVGAFTQDTGRGQVELLLGSSSGLTSAWTLTTDRTAQLGYSLAAAGDTNGDAIDDLLVGAHLWANGEVQEGRAQLFHGFADRAFVSRFERAGTGSLLEGTPTSFSVTALGGQTSVSYLVLDWNGDGAPDEAREASLVPMNSPNVYTFGNSFRDNPPASSPGWTPQVRACDQEYANELDAGVAFDDPSVLSLCGDVVQLAGVVPVENALPSIVDISPAGSGEWRVTATDPGLDDTLTVFIDWDSDGFNPSEDVSLSLAASYGEVSASHSYPTGPHTLTTWVVDDDGGTSASVQTAVSGSSTTTGCSCRIPSPGPAPWPAAPVGLILILGSLVRRRSSGFRNSRPR